MATAKVEEDDLRAAADSELNTDSNPDTAIVQKEDPPDGSNCSILALNTDCLLKIFSYLSMKNLLSVEMVCPQWKAVADLSWRRFTIFDCTKSFHRYLDSSYKRSLIRCGPYLKKICFPPLLHDGYTSELLKIVAKHCLNVEYAVLNDTQFRKPSIKNFAKILRRLKCLEITDSEFRLTYNILRSLFEKASKLKVLTFKGYSTKDPQVISKALRHLPTSITEINFGHLSYTDENFFVLLLRRCPNLEILTMSTQHHLYHHQGDIGHHLAKFTKLRQLVLKNSDMRLESLRPLLSLSLLEKLELSCPGDMDDDFLEKVAESMPNLQHLDIHAAFQRDVTDKGVKKLALLKNLEHLNLSYFNLITHEGIGAVAANGKLKELVLISTLVTDNVISTVLAHCHDLKFLDLSECSEITSEAVQTLFEIFTPTNNRARLTVILGGTEYMTSEMQKDEEFDDGDLFAPNLVIVRSTNNIDSLLLKRYGSMFDSDDDDDDEDFGDIHWYEVQDCDWHEALDSDYEFQLDDIAHIGYLNDFCIDAHDWLEDEDWY